MRAGQNAFEPVFAIYTIAKKIGTSSRQGEPSPSTCSAARRSSAAGRLLAEPVEVHRRAVVAARTLEQLWRVTGERLDAFMPAERAYIAAAGHDAH